ncbi:hypothetical protein [Arcobacter sp.]|uniref:hypothetical protein n=1 Tax=unclassified Arcobacter TaxID=2593671 RepID=UPI003AFFC6D2
MSKIKLLIIEDSEDAIKNYEETIKRINRTSEDYKYYFAKNLEEANDYIEYFKLDSAIVDLNLSGEESDLSNNDGNAVIDGLISNFRIPIFVVTGEPQKLDSKFDNNNLVSLIRRGDKTTHEILSSIKDNYNSPTIQYFSRNGFLETKINDFYWTNLQETLNSWNAVSEEHPSDINKILSRHTVSCLNEQFYVSGNIGKFDKFHNGEMYIIPPIKIHYHTGDIIQKDDELFIILNPACDVVNINKLEYYLLVKIIKIENIYEIKYKSTSGKESYFDSNLRKGNKTDRYHYLPKFSKIDSEYVIDFQNIKTVNIGSISNPTNGQYINERELIIKRDYKRIASISSPFLKDIISRFSLFYSRQGQPNLLN